MAIKEYPVLMAFIRGYFDGDGSLSYYSKENIIKPKASLVGTKEFLEGLQDVLLYRNIKSSVLKDNRTSGTYVLTIS